MPMRRETVRQGGTSYATLDMFVGPVDHTDVVRVDLSGLTANEVDEDGYLKPGVPLMEDGTLVAADGDDVHGLTVEPVKVAKGNSGLSGNADVAVATIGQPIQAVAEENLGRDFTAAEVNGLEGSSLVLV